VKTYSAVTTALLFTTVAVGADVAVAPAIKVHLPREGTLEVDGKPISIEEFRVLVGKAAKQDKETVIRITASPSVGHQMPVTLFEICRAAGLTRISIETTIAKKA
jgi:biopolymer transport protein ExbD